MRSYALWPAQGNTAKLTRRSQNGRARTISVAKWCLYTNISIKYQGETHAKACGEENRCEVASIVAATQRTPPHGHDRIAHLFRSQVRTGVAAAASRRTGLRDRDRALLRSQPHAGSRGHAETGG